MEPMSEPASHQIESAQLRRSPRYGVFLALGVALGILAALVLTFGFDGTAVASAATGALYSTSQVFGFLCLVCIPVGLAIGGAVALIFDRMLARRAREVHINHETLHVAPE